MEDNIEPLWIHAVKCPYYKANTKFFNELKQLADRVECNGIFSTYYFNLASDDLSSDQWLVISEQDDEEILVDIKTLDRSCWERE